MRITESQLRRIIREQMQKSFQGFDAYNPNDPTQKIGVDTTAGRAPPRTIDYESFKQMYNSMGGTVYDEETLMQLYDDYTHRRITWGQVKDAAMLD